MPKRLIKLPRLLFTLFVVVFLCYIQERPIASNEPIQLYTAVCHDDLRGLFLEAIRGAKKSIHLMIYSLNDPKIIQALNQKAAEAIEITVIHDPKTPQAGYERLKSIRCIPAVLSGLMHQKILIIDNERVLISSANLTTESLRLHDNLVMGLNSPELAQTILLDQHNHQFVIEEQRVEFWTLPRDRQEGFERLMALIEHAHESLLVAMYTWTHPQLTEAVIRAYTRGVHVEIILDQGQANGVGQRELKRLTEAGIPVWLSNGQKLLHHKCAWVDGHILVSGSANWTRAAFSRNKDCFFVLHNLTEIQRKKLEIMWTRTRTVSSCKN